MSAGIYLHIPFCKSRCSYCDFATDVYKGAEIVEKYVSALKTEITRFSERLGPKKIRAETIYFGGGTPSLLSPNHVERILETVYSSFRVLENPEITLEMNPATVTRSKLRDFQSLGINRASFGVQTFNDKALKILARGHDSKDAFNTLRLLREVNFENVSFDLIAGLPNQSLEDWRANLDKALGLVPEHISLYLLEIHEGTPLAEQIRSRRQPHPDEDLATEMYELMIESLAINGYDHYEISNFAKPGFESRHNNKYWLCEPVYGFGVSAHSFDGKTRWSNERETNKYLALVEDGKNPIVEKSSMTQEQLSQEFAFLKLRLRKGLGFREFQTKFGYDLKNRYLNDFKQFEKSGLIEFSKDNIKLTEKGFLYSNEIFGIFV